MFSPCRIGLILTLSGNWIPVWGWKITQRAVFVIWVIGLSLSSVWWKPFQRHRWTVFVQAMDLSRSSYSQNRFGSWDMHKVESDSCLTSKRSHRIQFLFAEWLGLSLVKVKRGRKSSFLGLRAEIEEVGWWSFQSFRRAVSVQAMDVKFVLAESVQLLTRLLCTEKELDSCLASKVTQLCSVCTLCNRFSLSSV